MTTSSCLTILLVLWTFISPVLCTFLGDSLRKPITRQPQRIVFFILGGPAVWVIGAIYASYNFIDKNFIEKFRNWLTKE